ncbi:MAG: NADAR family protein [Bacteroides thetaiotaomicron]
MICEFRGAYRFMSNFYPAEVVWLGQTFPTVEHAFQAAKFAAHPEIVQEIRNCMTPGETKRIASKYRALIEPSWFIYSRELVMMYLLQQKFSKGSDLHKKLMETGNHELVEGNTWGDVFWGVCNGKGENNFGKMLMFIRDNE